MSSEIAEVGIGEESQSVEEPLPVVSPEVDATSLAVPPVAPLDEPVAPLDEPVAPVEEPVVTAIPDDVVKEGSAEVQITDDEQEDDTKDKYNADLSDSGIRNKELKSLLQLSKEANLDTNITRKRTATTPDPKRSMRSQNPEFAVKQQTFLSKVAMGHVDTLPDRDEKTMDGGEGVNKKRKRDSSGEVLIGGAIDGKSKKLLKSAMELVLKNKDGFCWRCHRDGVGISCTTCPRSYHAKCLKNANSSEHWICPECTVVLAAESVKTRSPALKNMPLGHLCKLLKFALKRMVQINDSEPFLLPVQETEFPDYKNYIVQPMDFTMLEKNIKANLYGSTKAFEGDAKWLLHNSIVFNSYQSKLTTIAKTIMKVCKQEMAEIENCSSCYLNANTKKSWFVEVCPEPHLLVWAKLKGFPFWPAKVLCTNNQGLVDVRFFGAHDRAWVSAKECFLYSIKDPNVNHYKREEINECIKEVDVYIQNLKSIYGRFNYPPYKTPYDIDHKVEQVQMFLPEYKSKVKADLEVPTSETGENAEKEEGVEEERSDEEDWEVRKYIEEGRVNKSPSPEPTSKQRVRHSKTPTYRKRQSKTPNSTTPTSKTLSSKIPSTKSPSLLSEESKVGLSPSPRIKTSRRSHSSRVSGTSDKSAKADGADCETSKDSSYSDDKSAAAITKDMLVVPTGKLKMADKLMKKLAVGSEENEPAEKEVEVVASDEHSPGDLMNVIESEGESEGVPTVHDIKQVILGNPSLENEEASSNVTTEDKTRKSLENNANISLLKNQGVTVKVKNKEKLEAKAKEKVENKSKDSNDKDKVELKKSRTSLKRKPNAESKLKRNLQQLKSKRKSIGGGKIRVTDAEHVSIEEDESLLEAMYFEVVEEQGQAPKESNSVENVNGASKRKRVPSVDEDDLSIHSKMVKLVDIDLIKNSKLLDIPGSPPTLSLKEKATSPNTLDGMVEIKYEVQTDEEESLSDDFLMVDKNLIVDNEENLSTIQKPVSLLKMTKSQKSAPISSDNVATVNTVTTKIATNTADTGGVMILTQPKTFVKNQIVLPPNQSITYGGNSIFVQHPQFSNYLIPTTALNVGTISLPVASTKSNQESETKSVASQSSNAPKIQNQSISSIVSKPLMSTAQQVLVSKPHISKPTQTTTTYVKPNVTQAKLTTNQTSKHQPFSNIGKITLNVNTNTPKQPLTKQLPPLRKANPPNVVATSFIVNTVNNVATTGTTTIPPPLCSLITTSPTNTTSVINTTAPMVSVSTATTVINNTATNLPSVTSAKADSTDDYSFLTSHVPERLMKNLIDIPWNLPALTPKPPGPLSINLSPGISSSAGPVASKINLIAHKLTDYLRGMLIEFLSEFGAQENSAAVIASLKLEVERLKQTHNLEVSEMKKNLQTILKEMQKNYFEERQKIIEETTKLCEVETIKRVDEAKSKQWCSNCMKEAQFYCCWNTSYCDYPCQIEHWPTHMEKCTQSARGESKAASPKPHFVKKTPVTKVLPGTSLLSASRSPKVYSSPKRVIQIPKPPTSDVKINIGSNNTSNSTTMVEQSSSNYKLSPSTSGPITIMGGKLFHRLNNKVVQSPGNLPPA